MAYEYFRMVTAAKYHSQKAKAVVNTSDLRPAKLVRYDSTINRQFYKAMHELEGLQRIRPGEDAAIRARISHDVRTFFNEDRSSS